MVETAQLTVRLDLAGNLTSGLAGAQRQLKGLGASVGRVGKGFGQLGGGIARAGLVVGGAAIAGLTGAAKAAIDFEDAFAGVRKTVDEADLAKVGLSFDALSDAFRGMAREIPIAATEFAVLGETAGALGVKAQDIEEFVRITALLGVTTDLAADQAADSLGRIGTILGFTGKDYADFADSLVALGNKGASTESEIIEIVKRFAAEGEAAGLATSQIAALASATASLGFAPERGGTALSRVFANMATNISLANAKGEQFSAITGRSVKDLQKSLDKGEGLGIFLDVLKGLKGLSPTDAARTLKALGITNTSDRTIFRTMAENLPFINDQLDTAADATGALSDEATKRFDTIASKLKLVKQNLIDAGIEIGTGFLPALGRAATKLSAFLNTDSNRSELRAIGEDIGEAIDGIDWAKVLDGAKQFVGVLRTTLSVTMSILETLNKLPTEIKAAAAAFLLLDQASGGLIGAGVGNVLGGVGETAIRGVGSQLPGVGRLFALPVFVTNFPVGFGSGGGPGSPIPSTNSGGLGKVIETAKTVAQVVIPAVAIKESGILDEIRNGFEDAVFGNRSPKPYAPNFGQYDPATGAIPLELGKINGTLKTLKPPNALGGQSSQDNDPDKRGWRNAKELKAELERIGFMVNAAKDDQVGAINTSKTAVTEAQADTKRATTTGSFLTSASTRRGASAIVGAIGRIPAPIVNVNVTATTVTRSITYQNRSGNGLGSAGGAGNGPMPV